MSDERDPIKDVFSKPSEDQQYYSESDRVCFPGISSRAYEHPTDRAALTALRKVPGFDTVLRKIFGFISERALRLLFLANAVKAGEDQFSRVYKIYKECCAILDVEPPELFIAQTPIVNAGAIGVDHPFIVINSGVLDLLDDDELRFVLGHELGHVLSGHALYKTMIRILLNMVGFRVIVPLGGVAIWGVVMMLREWDRKSELSADRAGLLCLQDPYMAYRIQMKTAGGRRPDEMNVDAFIAQAEEYERAGDLRDSALKFINLMTKTHPFAVLRLAELKRWVDSGGFEKILHGDYAKRADDNQASLREDISASEEAYREQKEEPSGDNVNQFFNDLSENVTSAGAVIRDQVRGFFKRAEDLFNEKPNNDEEPSKDDEEDFD